MIAGLEDISDGELWIGDKLVNYLEPKERDLAMVFQSYALYPQMNIYDNIAFSLQVRKVPKKEIDKIKRYLKQNYNMTEVNQNMLDLMACGNLLQHIE